MSGTEQTIVRRLTRQFTTHGLLLAVVYSTWGMRSELAENVSAGPHALLPSIAYGLVLALVVCCGSVWFAGGLRTYRKLGPRDRERVGRAIATGVPDDERALRAVEQDLARALMPAGHIGRVVGVVVALGLAVWFALLAPRPGWWLPWVVCATVVEVVAIVAWSRGERAPLERLRASENQPAARA